MTKTLERPRKIVTLVILVTFLLETTVVAEVRLLQSVLPARVPIPPPTYSHALPVFPETPAPSVPSPGLSTPVASSSSVASSRTEALSTSAPAIPPSLTVGDIIRLSLSSTQEQGNRDSQAASSSADGRWVAFQSRATNLVPGDTNGVQDVFVRDRESGETERVSVASDATEANKDSGQPSISGDGRYVAFQSKASHLVAGDTNRKRDVFVHDRETGETVRVSVASDGSQAEGESGFPAISADGRFVAFESKPLHLLPGRTNGETQIFLHDQDTGEITLVSVSSDGPTGNKDSRRAAISADSRFVAFQSKATNLVPFDTNRKRDIFVHDRDTGETTRVSVASDGTEGDRDSGSPTINADGRFVAFGSKSTNVVVDDTNGKVDVFVHDRDSGETTRASVSGEGDQGNGSSGAPSISASGRFVAFESKATNLVDDDTDHNKDVFVRDRSRELTIRVTVGKEGPSDDDSSSSDDSSSDDSSSDDDSSDDDSSGRRKGGEDSSRPSISADGRYVSFQSESSILVPDDTNKKEDVFQAPLDLNRPPDAMDDSATTLQETPLDINVLANDNDPDGDTLSIEELGDPANGEVSLNADDTVQYTPAPGFSGPDSFTYTIGDGHGATDTATVTIEVTPLNQPPEVDAGLDQIITLPVNTVTLTGEVSDDGLPQGSSVSVLWSQLGGPAANIDTPTETETIVTFLEAGDYLFELSASDGEFTTRDEVSVQVFPPAVIELSVGDAVVTEGHNGMAEAVVAVTLSSASTGPVSVDFSTFDGTATASCDYLSRFGTVTFPPGEMFQSIRVPVVGDLAGEVVENFMVIIGNPVGALINDDEGMVTVEDDDGPNNPPTAPADRFPPNGATGISLDPTLSWASSDPDGDAVTHDVFFGTSLDTTGQEWIELCSVNAGPGPRAGSAAALDDTNDRLILFSGEAGPSSHPEDIRILQNATASGGPPTWLTLNANVGPVGRQQAAAAYDAATNRFILHGGCTGDCGTALSDTWVLTNANGLLGAPEWIRLPDAPVERRGATSAYDAATNRLIVFGGSQGTSDLNDVWVLEDANGIGAPQWEELTPTGPSPPPRSNAAGGYDRASNRVIVFGGRQANDVTLNDTWSLSSANGLDGTPEWTKLEPSGIPPAARWGHAGVYDEGAGRLVIFGGTSAGFADGLNFVANDLWMLTDADGSSGNTEWIQLAPARGPPLGRLLGAAAYSAAQNRMAVVSGKNNRAALPNDLFEDHWVLTNAIGTLPLVSAGQTGTTFGTTTPAASDTYFWRVVSHDTNGARAGSPIFRFRPNARPSVDAGPDQTIFLAGSGDGTASLTGSVSDDDLREDAEPRMDPGERTGRHRHRQPQLRFHHRHDSRRRHLLAAPERERHRARRLR